MRAEDTGVEPGVQNENSQESKGVEGTNCGSVAVWQRNLCVKCHELTSIDPKLLRVIDCWDGLLEQAKDMVIRLTSSEENLW